MPGFAAISRGQASARNAPWRLLCLTLIAACSSHGTSSPPAGKPAAPAADGGSGNGGIENIPDAAPVFPDAKAYDHGSMLVLSPAASTLTLGLDDAETVTFSTTLSDTDMPANDVRYSVSDKQLGTIDAVSGVFTPSGVAGVVTIVATAGSLQSTTTLAITIDATQEGDPDAGGMPAGAGGLGGVGGEGGGTKLSDAKLRAALDATPQTAADFAWLYPYDHTVWPRGLPAPLLQWSSPSVAAVGVRLHIEVDDDFRYDGYFGPPQALAAGQPITRLPIPQQVWKRAVSSGKTMRVTLTLAAKSGGAYTAYASGKTLTWTIAPTTLKGTVYYNSYGTKLAENYTGAKGGNGKFGGATLAIRGDAFDPVLVAGKSGDASGCRVCHTVSADGSLMIAQHESNMASSAYDLNDMNAERAYPSADDGKFGWAALSPDGALALGNAGPPGDNPANRASLDHSALYKTADGSVLPLAGFADVATQAATPSFAVDGKQIAFNLYAGPAGGKVAANGGSLVVMDFAATGADQYAASNPRAVFTSSSADQLPAWPYFLPDGNALVFELEKQPGSGGERFVTRNGARGELWWTTQDGRAHALDQANGKGYLPNVGVGHGDDTTLQYEPTVAPIVAGGYAWMVFTSRRAYGNVATRDPYESDARAFDLTPGNPAGPTTKKLWISAIDMPPKPGTDPSHPAFYLPAQELYAGNSRGFWVLDACKPLNDSCGSGDECCGGFCREVGEFGAKVCTDTPPSGCAMEYESCNVDGDCCPNASGALSCIAGRCARLQLN
jgi:hypothetical protein